MKTPAILPDGTMEFPTTSPLPALITVEEVEHKEGPLATIVSQRGADYAARLYATPDGIAPDITKNSCQRIWIDKIKRPPHQDIKGSS